MKKLSISTNILIYLIGMNTALLVASNAAGAKMIDLWGGLSASATVFPYALSFLFTDIISELYGPKRAKSAVRVGFLGLILSVVFFKIAILAPAADFWKNQEGYEATLGLGIRLLIGGWTSYMVSQHIDVWLFHKIKKRTKGRYLWIRNNLSTIFSQFIDTCIFITISFYGLFPLLPAIIGQYIIKLAIAGSDTIIIYPVVSYLRRFVNEYDDE